jgi:hypothetical protein
MHGGNRLPGTARVCPLLPHAGDVDNDLEIFRSANTGEATLIDAQGNRVAVVGKPTQYGKMVIWDVSRVLLSGECGPVGWRWEPVHIAPCIASGTTG